MPFDRPEDTPHLRRRFAYGDRFVVSSAGGRLSYFKTIGDAVDGLIQERKNAPAAIWSIEKILGHKQNT